VQLMQESRPSLTALRVAMRRAAHQLYDSPIIFHDPIAVPILGPEYLPQVNKTATKLEKPASVALRAFLVARSRYAEDTLAAAVTTGTTQYVLLGAGLDTFAYRNPHPNLRVFEVDHPATQQWKHELLQKNSIAIPGSLSFVPVDFEVQSLPEQLLAAGFDPQAKTLFAWLGVVPYLTLPAFQATVAFIAKSAQGSGVVLDYGLPRHTLPLLEQLERDSLAARVQLAGEPFQLFFTPEEIAAELQAFCTIEDIGFQKINARYFPDRSDHLMLRSTGARLLSAQI
jgi:methyltransferase (TIGR00027 family)